MDITLIDNDDMSFGQIMCSHDAIILAMRNEL